MRTRGRAAVGAGGIAAGGLALAVGVAAATYPRWRPWCLTWGATKDEAERTLPGDDLLTGPGIVSTRAVWVDAPPGSVWPWLVQMGPGRAGAYTYDWIENLFGLGMHSADVILPQYQHLKVGDTQRLGARGPLMRVAVLESERSVVLRSEDGNWVWAFSLMPVDAGTRLISRNRIAVPSAARLTRALYGYVMEPGSLIMERKMLLGIKQRAERLARDPADLRPPDATIRSAR
jgi:hypothetical protein